MLPDPLEAIERLNEELVGRDRLSLCSVAAALLCEGDGPAASMEVICAGHPQAVLSGGEVRAVGAHGPIAGAFATSQWPRVTAELEEGATLVLYTDGVLDTVGSGGERFGKRRLLSALAGAEAAHEAVRRIETALRAFEVGAQADDTAVLAIECVPAPVDTASPAPSGSRQGRVD